MSKEVRVADFSDWQNGINFNKLSEKFYGVIFKVAEGKTETECAAAYAKSCNEIGIPYGLYVYSRAKTADEARAEARNVIEVMRREDMKPSLGVWFDIESPELVGENGGEGIGATQITANASAFISELNSCDIYAGIYAPWWVIRDRINTGDLAAYVPYWVSWIGAKNPLDGRDLICKGWQNQVSDVNGVAVGNYIVDSSIWYL